MNNSPNKLSFVLKPSTVSEAGVGVFALHDIQEGAPLGLFLDDFGTEVVSVEDIPEELQSYCINKGNGKLLCPKDFRKMSIGNYINHSANPNVVHDKEKGYIALRDIEEGEELLVDYGDIGDQYDVPKNEREPYV